MDERTARELIVEVGKRLYAKDFVASNDGNISLRLDEERLLITPTGVSKGYMTEEMLLVVDLQGRVLQGKMKTTSEMPLHLAIYEERPDVQAVVHAHPPTATGFAVARIGLDKISLPEVIYNLGAISLASYGTPSTNELPNAVRKVIGDSDGVLLANHGAVTVGSDVMQAYYRMETLEAVAKITLTARLLGGETFLPQEEVERLYAMKRGSITKTDIDSAMVAEVIARVMKELEDT
ncbi:MAG: class II aldolase/adducin family protein [Spirochaetales bacterium]|nr:class II aldolase/adducin family protein [Spirochaetales bacterium]